MSEHLEAARRLQQFLVDRFWTGEALVGPDNGVRFNRRVGRFIKSALPFVRWSDDCYYLQAQGYWVMSNWLLHDLAGDPDAADLADRCARDILKQQQPEGYWRYSHPGWAGRVTTVECIFGGLGLLTAYERTGERAFLEGAARAYGFLVGTTGFQPADQGYAINYFAGRATALVPNNSTLALYYFGRLAQVAQDDRYLEHCTPLVLFLISAQQTTGELPYAIRTALYPSRPHFQCYQYNAFELTDLAEYYRATEDRSVLPLIERLCDYLLPSVKGDGSTRFDCSNGTTQIIYNTAAIAAALCTVRRMGLCQPTDAEERAYRYILGQQDRLGGFGFSRREHHLLRDRRYYPRAMAMILYHLLVKAGEGVLPAVQVRSMMPDPAAADERIPGHVV